MKHTQGKWITDESHRNEWEGITVWAGDMVVCHVVKDQHEEIEENARLISAAPELLEALKVAKAIIASMPGEREALQIIHAAIAKAEG